MKGFLGKDGADVTDNLFEPTQRSQVFIAGSGVGPEEVIIQVEVRTQAADQLIEACFSLLGFVIQMLGAPAVVRFVVEFGYQLHGMLYGIIVEKLPGVNGMVATPVTGMPLVFFVFKGIVDKSNDA